MTKVNYARNTKDKYNDLECYFTCFKVKLVVQIAIKCIVYILCKQISTIQPRQSNS